jgi:hypothetical protein
MENSRLVVFDSDLPFPVYSLSSEESLKDLFLQDSSSSTVLSGLSLLSLSHSTY